MKDAAARAATLINKIEMIQSRFDRVKSMLFQFV
jgi:hypothetical protein